MSLSTPSKARGSRSYGGMALALLCLVAVLAFLFKESFKPEAALFANDGPLGVLKSEALQPSQAVTGFWMDLYWVGINGTVLPVGVSNFLLWLLGPVGFAKFYGPITLLFLGVCAWMFFRTLKMPPALCVVAALAAALNTNFFSNTCWGLGTRSTALGAAFLALAALNTKRLGSRWLNTALAGLAVGLSVIEGADNGVLFSLFVAAFVLFQSLIENKTIASRMTSSLRLLVVVGFSLFIAVQVLIPLVGIATKGSSSITSPQQPEDPAAKWDFATQWSLAPMESLRVIIPGLFGYRVDPNDGSEYWGRVGQQPGWEQHHQGLARHSGAGEYAGVLVVLVGIWALAQSLMRAGNGTSIYSDTERKYIWFWAAMGLVALVFAWGRFAPFYRLIYPLPFFSGIRNPMKFMHPCHLSLMVLFGYGLLGLSRRYLEPGAEAVKKRASIFEKRWTIGCIIAFAFSLICFGIYASSRSSLVKHLMDNGFSQPTQAGLIADFSIAEVGKFVFFLLIAMVSVLLIQFGVFSGSKSTWAALLLGVVLTVDLARADLPWIQYYDYRDQYVSNPVLDVLKDKSWEHRTIMLPVPVVQGMISKTPLTPPQMQEFGTLNYVYQAQWLQKQFQYYNIQSLDMAQDPRPPADKIAYRNAVSANPIRYWQLTNARYILGLSGGFIDALNQMLDPVQMRFKQHTAFAFTQTQGSQNIGAQTNDTGPWALIEFTGALPRAKVYSQWQINTNNEATLAKLGDPAFDPWQTLLVNDEISAPAASNPNTNSAAGTVDFASYAPKQIELNVNASAPSVLLLNDKYDPAWKVWVDGKPAKLLRCNYLMRGVQVPAGASKVRFHFEPSLAGMKVTLLAVIVGVVLCGLLFVVRPTQAEEDDNIKAADGSGRGGAEKPTPAPEKAKPRASKR